MASMTGCPRLLVVADRSGFDHDDAWLRAVAQVVTALPPDHAAIQIRCKHGSLTTRRRQQRSATETVRAYQPKLTVFINGAIDDALQAKADGVHWPQSAIPSTPSPVSRSQGRNPELLIGASVHGMDSARKAYRAGAQFLVYGPVFAPRSKIGPPVGLNALRRVVRQPCPVLAIGGVRPQNIHALLEAGAHGVAGVTEFMQARDRPRAVFDHLRALEASQPPNPLESTLRPATPSFSGVSSYV